MGREQNFYSVASCLEK